MFCFMLIRSTSVALIFNQYGMFCICFFAAINNINIGMDPKAADTFGSHGRTDQNDCDNIPAGVPIYQRLIASQESR